MWRRYWIRSEERSPCGISPLPADQQPSKQHQNAVFTSLEFFWKSPESDDAWYKSEGLDETIWRFFIRKCPPP